MRRDWDAGGCVRVGVGGDIAAKGAVGFLRVIADFEIAAGGVVCLHAASGDPREIAMRWNGGVRFIQVGVDIWVAGEGVCFRAVGEVVDVFRTDDVDEFERGIAARQGLCLTLSRPLSLNGWGNGRRACIRR